MTQESNSNENKTFMTEHNMTRKKAIFFKDDLFYKRLTEEEQQINY